MCRAVASAFVIVSLAACASSAVGDYFAQADLSFPLQVNAPAVDGPRLVCPGCEEPERLAPEHEELLRSGLNFVQTGLSVQYLRGLTDADAEAFVVADAYLFEDPPGGEIRLAVSLSVFKLATAETGEIYVPHKRHTTNTGGVLELQNILLLRRTEGRWEYSGWVL